MKCRNIQIFVTCLLLFTVSFVHAQDLTGVWQGHFRSGNNGARASVFDDRYKLEVQIAQHEKSIQAVTYSYLSSIFYGKAATTGAINLHNGKALLQEIKLLEVRNQSGDVCLMTYFFQYSRSGDDEFLEGTYVSMNMRDSSNCGKGTVFLHKVASSDFYKEPFLVKREKELESAKNNPPPPAKQPAAAAAKTPAAKTPATASAKTPATASTRPPATATAKPPATTTNKPPIAPKMAPPATFPSITATRDSSTGMGKHFPVITPRVLQSRDNILAKSLTVNTNEVTLNIYDDGAIDHDTISVYLDKRIVVNHAMLTDRPIVVTLHFDDDDAFHEIVMVAENEGEIPPNTSLMIVKAGDKEYEVRITSTEQKNAVVTFKYEKK